MTTSVVANISLPQDEAFPIALELISGLGVTILSANDRSRAIIFESKMETQKVKLDFNKKTNTSCTLLMTVQQKKGTSAAPDAGLAVLAEVIALLRSKMELSLSPGEVVDYLAREEEKRQRQEEEKQKEEEKRNPAGLDLVQIPESNNPLVVVAEPPSIPVTVEEKPKEPTPDKSDVGTLLAPKCPSCTNIMLREYRRGDGFPDQRYSAEKNGFFCPKCSYRESFLSVAKRVSPDLFPTAPVLVNPPANPPISILEIPDPIFPSKTHWDWNSGKAIALILSVALGVFALSFLIAFLSRTDNRRPSELGATNDTPGQISSPPPDYGPTCTKGCRCGNTCIDCSKKCRK